MASFGDEIKRERELRDISLKEIADATNISVRFLEALERNDFGALPGGVYVRGFIRSVAQHVGLDVDETLTAYQQEAERQEMLRESESGRGGHGAASRSGRRTAETAVAGGFAMTAILIGIVYWAGTAGTPEMPAPDPAAHSEALRARMKRAGALPSSNPAEAEPVAAPTAAEPPQSGTEEGGAERLVGIRALETTRVQLTCAGEVRFREDLWVGVERQFPCREPILLSAANAGAIEYSVDSQALKLLGEPGRAVRDVLVSIEPEPPASAGPAKPRPIQGASTAEAPEAPGTRP